MSYVDLPFNIEILNISANDVPKNKIVSSLDIVDGASSEPHDEGLFSVLIFGKPGTVERDLTNGYINLKTSIIIPKIYKELIKLKSLYAGIMSGKATAKWDNLEKDFYASNDADSDTGYGFFMTHFDDIVYKARKSRSRIQRVKLMEDYKGRTATKFAVVLPAGLRDFTIDASGRASKDEINDLYFRLISISNTVSEGREENSPALDVARYQLTLTYLEIYDKLAGVISGKKGQALDKMGGRKVDYGTRNVLTAVDNSRKHLFSDNAVTSNTTAVGLWQAMKGLNPISKYLLATSYLPKAITQGDGTALLVNKKTLIPEFVELDDDSRNTWASGEGLNSVLNRYEVKTERHNPVEVMDHWLLLVYQTEEHFKVFNDIRELPNGFDKTKVRPITLIELLYLSGYRKWNTYVIYTTRYPSTGIESTFPTYLYVKTTVTGKRLKELGEDWKELGEEFVAVEYPTILESGHHDSQSPPSSRLKDMGGDFDGDTGSGTIVFTNKSLEEAYRFLSTKDAWTTLDNKLRASSGYDTVSLVIRATTGRK